MTKLRHRDVHIESIGSTCSRQGLVQRSNSLASIPDLHSDFGLGPYYTKGKKQILCSRTEISRDGNPNS